MAAEDGGAAAGGGAAAWRARVEGMGAQAAALPRGAEREALLADLFRTLKRGPTAERPPSLGNGGFFASAAVASGSVTSVDAGVSPTFPAGGEILSSLFGPTGATLFTKVLAVPATQAHDAGRHTAFLVAGLLLREAAAERATAPAAGAAAVVSLVACFAKAISADKPAVTASVFAAVRVAAEQDGAGAAEAAAALAPLAAPIYALLAANAKKVALRALLVEALYVVALLECRALCGDTGNGIGKAGGGGASIAGGGGAGGGKTGTGAKVSGSVAAVGNGVAAAGSGVAGAAAALFTSPDSFLTSPSTISKFAPAELWTYAKLVSLAVGAAAAGGDRRPPLGASRAASVGRPVARGFAAAALALTRRGFWSADRGAAVAAGLFAEGDLAPDGGGSGGAGNRERRRRPRGGRGSRRCSRGRRQRRLALEAFLTSFSLWDGAPQFLFGGMGDLLADEVGGGKGGAVAIKSAAVAGGTGAAAAAATDSGSADDPHLRETLWRLLSLLRGPHPPSPAARALANSPAASTAGALLIALPAAGVLAPALGDRQCRVVPGARFFRRFFETPLALPEPEAVLVRMQQAAVRLAAGTPLAEAEAEQLEALLRCAALVSTDVLRRIGGEEGARAADGGRDAAAAENLKCVAGSKDAENGSTDAGSADAGEFGAGKCDAAAAADVGDRHGGRPSGRPGGRRSRFRPGVDFIPQYNAESLARFAASAATLVVARLCELDLMSWTERDVDIFYTPEGSLCRERGVYVAQAVASQRVRVTKTQRELYGDAAPEVAAAAAAPPPPPPRSGPRSAKAGKSSAPGAGKAGPGATAGGVAAAGRGGGGVKSAAPKDASKKSEVERQAERRVALQATLAALSFHLRLLGVVLLNMGSFAAAALEPHVPELCAKLAEFLARPPAAEPALHALSVLCEIFLPRDAVPGRTKIPALFAHVVAGLGGDEGEPQPQCAPRSGGSRLASALGAVSASAPLSAGGSDILQCIASRILRDAPRFSPDLRKAALDFYLSQLRGPRPFIDAATALGDVHALLRCQPSRVAQCSLLLDALASRSLQPPLVAALAAVGRHDEPAVRFAAAAALRRARCELTHAGHAFLFACVQERGLPKIAAIARETADAREIRATPEAADLLFDDVVSTDSHVWRDMAGRAWAVLEEQLAAAEDGVPGGVGGSGAGSEGRGASALTFANYAPPPGGTNSPTATPARRLAGAIEQLAAAYETRREIYETGVLPAGAAPASATTGAATGAAPGGDRSPPAPVETAAVIAGSRPDPEAEVRRREQRELARRRALSALLGLARALGELLERCPVRSPQLFERVLSFLMHALSADLSLEPESATLPLVQALQAAGMSMIRVTASEGGGLAGETGNGAALRMHSILETLLQNQGATGPSPSSDLASALYFSTMARYLEDRTVILRILERLLARLQDPQMPSRALQRSMADNLPYLIRATMPTLAAARPLFARLLEDTFCGSNYAVRAGASLGVAAAVKAVGLAAIKELALPTVFANAISGAASSAAAATAAPAAATSTASRQGGLLGLRALAEVLGRLFEPYVASLVPVLLTAFSDSEEVVRAEARATARAVFGPLSTYGVKLVLPGLISQMRDGAPWRTKSGAIELLAAMAACAPRQLAALLPVAVPLLADAAADPHPTVREAARGALAAVAAAATNAEVVAGLAPLLLAALLDPAPARLQAALNAVLRTEFSHSLDAASLALLCPLALRALRERGADLKKKACAIVATLVQLCDADEAERQMFLPYFKILVPKVQEALVDPIPDVRTVAARALGTVARVVGDANVAELLVFFLQKLRSRESSVERSGAANGLSEVLAALGAAKLAELLPSLLQNAEHPDPVVREGYLGLFVFLPTAFGREFNAFVHEVLPVLLRGLSSDTETVREIAFRAAEVLVRQYGASHTILLLAPLEEGIFSPDWKIRHASVQLLGTLVARLMRFSEEDVQAAAASAGGADGEETVAFSLERRAFILASIYIVRSDENPAVRQAATDAWKEVVEVTPRTLAEILPILARRLLRTLSAAEAHQRWVAAHCLGDLAHKMPEKILPLALPACVAALKSQPSAAARRGALAGLTQLVAHCSSRALLLDAVAAAGAVPAVQGALVDEDAATARAAADALKALLATLGPDAVTGVVAEALRRATEPPTFDVHAVAGDRTAQIAGVEALLESAQPAPVLAQVVRAATAAPLDAARVRLAAAAAAVPPANLFNAVFPKLLPVFLDVGAVCFADAAGGETDGGGGDVAGSDEATGGDSAAPGDFASLHAFLTRGTSDGAFKGLAAKHLRGFSAPALRRHVLANAAILFARFKENPEDLLLAIQNCLGGPEDAGTPGSFAALFDLSIGGRARPGGGNSSAAARAALTACGDSGATFGDRDPLNPLKRCSLLSLYEAAFTQHSTRLSTGGFTRAITFALPLALADVAPAVRAVAAAFVAGLAQLAKRQDAGYFAVEVDEIVVRLGGGDAASVGVLGAGSVGADSVGAGSCAARADPVNSPSAGGACVDLIGLSDRTLFDAVHSLYMQSLICPSLAVREAAATGLGNAILRAPPAALAGGSVAIKLAGPIVRMAGDRAAASFALRAALLRLLDLMVRRVPASMKPLLPQLQTTFLRALSDTDSAAVVAWARRGLVAVGAHPACRNASGLLAELATVAGKSFGAVATDGRGEPSPALPAATAAAAAAALNAAAAILGRLPERTLPIPSHPLVTVCESALFADQPLAEDTRDAAADALGVALLRHAPAETTAAYLRDEILPLLAAGSQAAIRVKENAALVVASVEAAAAAAAARAEDGGGGGGSGAAGGTRRDGAAGAPGAGAASLAPHLRAAVALSLATARVHPAFAPAAFRAFTEAAVESQRQLLPDLFACTTEVALHLAGPVATAAQALLQALRGICRAARAGAPLTLPERVAIANVALDTFATTHSGIRLTAERVLWDVLEFAAGGDAAGAETTAAVAAELPLPRKALLIDYSRRVLARLEPEH